MGSWIAAGVLGTAFVLVVALVMRAPRGPRCASWHEENNPSGYVTGIILKNPGLGIALSHKTVCDRWEANR